MNENASGQSSQICLIVYTVLFWLTGFALIFIGLWTLLNPRVNYILDLVDFSENDPLLKGATYLVIISGTLTLLVGFIGCCGAINKSLCMIITFVLCLVVLFIADIAIACLALFYRNKFIANNFDIKLQSLVRENYGVALSNDFNVKVTTIIDRLQFNEQCCGSFDWQDWNRSRYRTAKAGADSLFGQDDVGVGAVPATCCVQIADATAINPVPRSLARCQQSLANKLWRHEPGCHKKLLDSLTVQTIIFTSVGLAFAAFQVIGICIALSLTRHIHSFYYITV